jgi:Flp pilus assembly protein TadD
MQDNKRYAIVGALAAIGLSAAASPSQASWFGGHKAEPVKSTQQTLTDNQVAEIHRAIDEQRFVDAGQMLDQAVLAGLQDPHIGVLRGELNLAQGRYQMALNSFKQVDGPGAVQAEALQGEGIALSLLGRSDDALPILQKSVSIDPTGWRAWNALGGEYDQRRQWAQAQEAYDHAYANSNGAAMVLNNRGYSKLLQNHPEEAALDFVEALKKRPNMVEARTNLRLAIAMRGEYDRAVANAAGEDQAALLNNAGFAAILRGDYAEAEDLLQRALKVRTEYYGRAQANLDLAHDLAANKTKPPVHGDH